MYRDPVNISFKAECHATKSEDASAIVCCYLSPSIQTHSLKCKLKVKLRLHMLWRNMREWEYSSMHS